MNRTNYDIDIIIPIYNGLTYVIDCLDSIDKYTTDVNYRLILINDASDAVTSQYLNNYVTKNINAIVHSLPENKGFVKACNIGFSLCNAPYVVLVNSDVIVTSGWLRSMLDCAESDPSIASVNPLTNHASQISVPIAPGANFIGMNDRLKNRKPKYPDIVTGVGFCMLLRKSILEEVGFFDEIYGRGYCEESDLCMRLTTSGYRTVVADNTYVFHKGGGTFTDRGERYHQNRKIFDQRWNVEYQRQYQIFKDQDPLAKVRKLFKPHVKWEPSPVFRQTYRVMRDRFKQKKYTGVLRAAVRGSLNVISTRTEVITKKSIADVARPDRLSVTYVLHNVAVAGGVLSVIQLVNELILLGVEARIVALREYPEISNWKLLSRPIIYSNIKELIECFPSSDIVVATHWTTASWVSEIIKNGDAKKAVYFLQDYEAWFFPEEDSKSRQKVKDTYELIDNKVVKSEWLTEMVKNDGYQTKKIWLGMDLGVFYPMDTKPYNNLTIVAMARPRTPRRGFSTLISALSTIKSKMKNINIILFGDDLSKQNIPFQYTDKGVIYTQNELALLYSSADIFIDASDFQGFGRTALEAMACKTACVLTRVGGVTEYAKHEINCLLVAPQKPDEIAESVYRLVNDQKLSSDIINCGIDTANQFSHKVEAQRTLEYFNSL